MPGAIGMGAHPKSLWPGVKSWFGTGYGEHPNEYEQLFEIMTSSQAWEESVKTTGFPLMPVKEFGKATTYASHTQKYVSRLTHIAYSLGFIVTFEEILNNLYPKLAGSRAKSLGFSKRQTIERICADVYNNAFSSTYTGGDGKELLATDHPSATTFSNELAVAADFSDTALEDILIQIAGAVDDNGHQIALMGQKLIVPRQLMFEADRVLNSTLRSGTAENDKNVLSGKLSGGFTVNHYLTDSDAWFVRTNVPDGMVMYKRHDIDLERDNDFDTKNAKAMTYTYFSCGWNDPLGLYGSPGA